MNGRVILALAVLLGALAMGGWSLISGFAVHVSVIPAIALVGIALTLLAAMLGPSKGPRRK